MMDIGLMVYLKVKVFASITMEVPMKENGKRVSPMETGKRFYLMVHHSAELG